MCIDYQALNAVSEKNAYLLLRIQECLDWFGTSLYLTKIDLISGYWHVLVKEEYISKTAFIMQYKRFEFTAMLFGLTYTLAIFQSMINTIFWPYLDKFPIVYLDDDVIYYNTKEEHLEYVEKVFKVLSNHQLYAKPSKWIIGAKSLEFFGHVVENSTVKLRTSKVKAIDEWPILKTVYKV